MPFSSENQIVPDYTRPVEKVYQDACAALHSFSGRIDFLMACNLATRTIDGPTWVADFSIPRQRRARWESDSFHASNLSTANTKLQHKNVIEVTGVLIGTVSWDGNKAPHDSHAIASTVIEWFQSDPQVGFAAEMAGALDTFTRTMHWDFLQERFPIDYSLPTLADARRRLKDVISHPDTFDPLHLPHVRDRSYLMTESGHRGLTSAVPSLGDQVYVILGCAMPMLLRPGRNGGYQVVGSTYLHGLMDGEALLGRLEKNWKIDVGAHPEWYGSFRSTNTVTGEVTQEDPRLGPLPPDWQRIEKPRTPADPMQFARYRNKSTGEVLKGDPRLLPEALKDRCVKLENVKLV